MTRFINPVPQFGDDAGQPLPEGKLYFFESGSATLKDIFNDVNRSIPQANPVILTGAGRVPNIFYDGSARVKLTDSDDVQIWDRDPVGGESGEGQFSDWNSLTIFDTSDIVREDGLFYISLTDNNQGNSPSASPINWSQIKFIGAYNTNETYSIGDIAQGSDNLLYSSKTNGNLNNNPTTDTTNWKPASNNADTSGPALSFFLGTG
jgi:hypothetical protein